jgi:hypothetical protein
MNQSDMRKWHRSIGIIIALFIIFQAGSGLLITILEFSDTPTHSSEAHEHAEQEEGASAWHVVLGWIHHGSGSLMDIYRILLGVGILAQTIIGVMLFFDIRRRVKSRQS